MSDSERPSPEALLDGIRRREAAARRGRLKVFVGMCPGVGKTFAMLQAAQGEWKAGRDVVIGYVETHGRRETDALAMALPQLPRRRMIHRGVALEELDLDGLLARRPQLALVDELAHTNAPGSRHPKRWQDVAELLDAGIDVYTTLNVQHVESRAGTVRQITGVEIRETVPDSVLDPAVLELVDLPPRELLARLEEGRVYLPERAGAAARHFFRESNLTALRELALRLVADHVGADTKFFRNTVPGSDAWKTDHLLLVGVGPSPYSESLVRWTRRMADGLSCRWMAVHVEGPRTLSAAAQGQLERNLANARELGAEVITTTDDDVVRGLLRIGRQRNATQIIVGKPAGSGWLEWWFRDRFLRRLARESGDMDLLVVRAEKQARTGGTGMRLPPFESGLRQYLFAGGVVAATALLNLVLNSVAGPRVPGLVFLLAVVLLGLKVGRGPVLLAGSLSALVWNFLFLSPRYTFVIEAPEDAVLFSLYFVVAIVLGQLVSRIRLQEQAERRREERASALYEFTRELSEATSREEVVWQIISQVHRALHLPVEVLLEVDQCLVSHPDSLMTVSPKERGVAEWAFHQRKTAGPSTGNVPGADAIHVPLFTDRRAFGVVAVRPDAAGLTLAQRDLLESFARQAALILERIDLRKAAEQARLLAESERFSQALLNSISHELRTPLAASTSAASALAASDDSPPAQRRALVEEILESNARLNRVVGNLLDVTRIESGMMRARPDWHDARDLVQTTLRELRRELATHPVSVEIPPGPMLAWFDYSLMQHALENLLRNAVVHTPAGTPVELRAERDGLSFVLIVADRGPGIPADLVSRVFDKFFRAPGAPTGGSGLGLTLVRGFAEAHGGTVVADNRPGGGARFTLRLPQPGTPPEVEPG